MHKESVQRRIVAVAGALCLMTAMTTAPDQAGITRPPTRTIVERQPTNRRTVAPTWKPRARFTQGDRRRQVTVDLRAQHQDFVTRDGKVRSSRTRAFGKRKGRGDRQGDRGCRSGNVTATITVVPEPARKKRTLIRKRGSDGAERTGGLLRWHLRVVILAADAAVDTLRSGFPQYRYLRDASRERRHEATSRTEKGMKAPEGALVHRHWCGARSAVGWFAGIGALAIQGMGPFIAAGLDHGGTRGRRRRRCGSADSVARSSGWGIPIRSQALRRDA